MFARGWGAGGGEAVGREEQGLQNMKSNYLMSMRFSFKGDKNILEPDKGDSFTAL